jgi:hypothetical protein
MRHGREKTICVRGKIHPFNPRLQIEDRSDEGRVLVTEAIMFLTCPCTCFDIIETSYVLAPGYLLAHFDEFGVLHHHGMHNTQEGFVGGENASAASQCVTYCQIHSGPGEP